jgi:glycerol-3-phosphate O-acyltransferase
VNFGAPLSMRAWAREHGLHFPSMDDATRRVEVGRVAARLMDGIGGVIPVLPVPLVASILMRDPTRALSELELKAAAMPAWANSKPVAPTSTSRATTMTMPSASACAC